jgi:hypothetical protein
MIATIIGTHTISISNPTTSNRLGIDAGFFGYTNLLICPFLYGWAMKVFLSVGKPKTDGLNVAFETN